MVRRFSYQEQQQAYPELWEAVDRPLLTSPKMPVSEDSPPTSKMTISTGVGGDTICKNFVQLYTDKGISHTTVQYFISSGTLQKTLRTSTCYLDGDDLHVGTWNASVLSLVSRLQDAVNQMKDYESVPHFKKDYPTPEWGAVSVGNQIKWTCTNFLPLCRYQGIHTDMAYRFFQEHPDMDTMAHLTPDGDTLEIADPSFSPNKPGEWIDELLCRMLQWAARTPKKPSELPLYPPMDDAVSQPAEAVSQPAPCPSPPPLPTEVFIQSFGCVQPAPTPPKSDQSNKPPSPNPLSTGRPPSHIEPSTVATTGSCHKTAPDISVLPFNPYDVLLHLKLTEFDAKTCTGILPEDISIFKMGDRVMAKWNEKKQCIKIRRADGIMAHVKHQWSLVTV